MKTATFTLRERRNRLRAEMIMTVNQLWGCGPSNLNAYRPRSDRLHVLGVNLRPRRRGVLFSMN